MCTVLFVSSHDNIFMFGVMLECWIFKPHEVSGSLLAHETDRNLAYYHQIIY